VHGTIFSIGGKFRLVLNFTRSYSSCPFLCTLCQGLGRFC